MNKTLLFKRIKVAMLVAIAVTLPTKWVNLNSLFIILFILAWLGDFLFNKKKPEFNFLVLISFTSFFVLSLISVLYSSNLPPLLSKLETRLAIVAFPLALLGSKEGDKNTLRMILTGFLVSCILVSLLCLGYTLYINYVNGISYHLYNNWLFSSDNLVERFGFHPSYFSIYCAFCVFIILFFYKEEKLRGWSSFLLILYLCVIQLLLASRVGIVSFTTLFMLTIVYEAYARKQLVVGVVIAFIFMGIIYVLVMNSQTVKDKFDALLDRNIHIYNERFRVNRRGMQWSSAVQVFRKSPIVGVGVGDMQDELQKVYLEKGFTEGYDNQYNPHNLFLDSAVALGILGVLSNLILFGVSFFCAIKQKNILYLQFLILFVLISLVESTFSVQKGVVFFFFFNTFFYSQLSNPVDMK